MFLQELQTLFQFKVGIVFAKTIKCLIYFLALMLLFWYQTLPSLPFIAYNCFMQSKIENLNTFLVKMVLCQLNLLIAIFVSSVLTSFLCQMNLLLKFCIYNLMMVIRSVLKCQCLHTKFCLYQGTFSWLVIAHQPRRL